MTAASHHNNKDADVVRGACVLESSRRESMFSMHKQMTGIFKL